VKRTLVFAVAIVAAILPITGAKGCTPQTHKGTFIEKKVEANCYALYVKETSTGKDMRVCTSLENWKLPRKKGDAIEWR
jgi:hypothetical protein